ncbi:MAG: acyl carrier protein [Streptosporangiaceae bacterium]
MTRSLNRIAADVFNIDITEVHDQMGPATFGQWTSLKQVQLAASVEDELRIKFTAREIRSIRSIGALRALVLSKSAAESHG